ncbi:NAD(P)-binding protein [Bimuria novae-zelandiae CBS 107.79]|uniref:NAD(P)-binding protein n=1 Tax=Bimuria novae-zelandiae CBS 107.79 TaxID=1447943 RepID=A0A6A5UX04_9PLEO|nr:NAD(P)-binding protein [Bimuria novae-zelandiae CBS 107.79]
MGQTVLVTGASGLLGSQVRREFDIDGWMSIGTGLSRISPPEIIKLDVRDGASIERVLDEVKPHVVVHCAANRFPDSCSADPAAAKALNVDSSKALAEGTTARGIFLIYISTDYVFSGRKGEAPYKPDSNTDPSNIYGQTKLDGEKAIFEVAKTKGKQNQVVVLRVPVLYGKADDPKDSAVNVLMSQLWESQKIQPGQPKIKVDNWALRYPTNTSDVGRVCRDIATLYLDPANANRELPSVLQFSSEDKMTKWEIVNTFAEIMGLPLEGMEPFVPDDDPGDRVKRPYDCHLDTSALKELEIDVGTVGFQFWWRKEVGAFR